MIVGIDTETYGGLSMKNYFGASGIRLLALATDNGNYCFDLWREQIPEWVIEILKDKSVKKVAHKASFDLKYLWKHGIEVNNITCSILAAKYAYNGLLKEFSLAFLCSELFGMVVNKEMQSFDYSGEITEAHRIYCQQDAFLSKSLYEIISKELAKYPLFEIEERLIPIVCRMEIEGVRFDLDAVKLAKEKNDLDVEETLRKIQASLPLLPLPTSAYNISKKTGQITSVKKDWKQKAIPYTGGLFFKPETRDHFLDALEVMGLPLPQIFDKKSGEMKASLSAGTYRQIDHPVGLLMEYYFKTKKLSDSYLGKMSNWVCEKTGKVHATVNQIGTVTGRFSITDPALQTIPKDPMFRKMIIADPGYSLLSLDFSQIEAIVNAVITGDENLSSVYRENKDLYVTTVAGILNKKPENVTKHERNKIGKPVALGSFYNQQVKGLQSYIFKTTGELYDLDQVKSFWIGFFKTYPKIKEYHNKTMKHCRDNWHQDLCFYSMGGRPRWFQAKSIPKKQSTWSDEEFVYANDAINHPIQSTVADAMKYAMVMIDMEILSKYKQVSMLLQVHDELVFSVPCGKEKFFSDLIADVMLFSMKRFLPLPCKVEATWGKNWGEAEGSEVYRRE